MSIAKTCAVNWIFFGTMIVLLGWISLSPTRAAAQAGDNAVCNSSSPPSGISCSGAFIDANVFTTTGDICARINAVLTSSGYSGGTVVDARGVSTTAQCSMNPWAGVTKSSIVLLPRGTITLCTTCTWLLPNETKIFGTVRTQTTIAAVSGFTGSDSNHAMIEMCSSLCFAVGIQDLRLDAGVQPAGNTFNGIVNLNANELSYVDHVSMHFVAGTGLLVGVGAGNSGPYSNLEISAGGSGCTGCQPTASTACVQLINAHTRGVHGITCTANGTPNAAIYLDGNNNTIEDLHFEGFQDGILVGDQAPAAANVLVNVNGASGGSTSGSIQNVVHICGSHSAGSPCPTTPNAVTDLSIIGAENYSTFNKTTILDDVTGTILNNTSGDASVGIYILGKVVGSGYSRFSTSPSVPTWGSGSAVPGSSCTTNGSLYSNTAGGSGSTLYVCLSNVWTNIK